MKTFLLTPVYLKQELINLEMDWTDIGLKRVIKCSNRDVTNSSFRYYFEQYHSKGTNSAESAMANEWLVADQFEISASCSWVNSGFVHYNKSVVVAKEEHSEMRIADDNGDLG